MERTELDKWTSLDKEEARGFLWDRGIHIEERIVRQLVEVLPEILARKKGFSLRSFWRNPDVPSLMGKGTAYKIKGLFEKGNLDPYLYYLDANRDWHPPVGEKQSGGRVRGLLNRWVAGLGEDSLREVLRSLHFLGLLPEDLRASAKELILPLEYKITGPRMSGKSFILASFLHDMGHGGFQIEN